MISLYFNGYCLDTSCKKRIDGRFSVELSISKELDGKLYKNSFLDNKISLILREEAEKEAINLGKNLIQRNLVGF